MNPRFARCILRLVGATAVALPLFASAAPIPTLFNTGVTATKAPAANNVAELHYTLISAPAGAATSLRTATSANGYPIGPWLGDDSLSDWIGPASDGQLNGPAGQYIYRTTFNLGGFNPLSASISGLWSADDGGLNILINGISTGIMTTANFTAFSSFAITSGFVAGLNTLDFVIVNGGGPTGLRVEMTGNAAAVPEPESLAIVAIGLVGLALASRRRARR